MKKSQLKKIIKEEIAKELSENEINFMPELDVDHHIVFQNPMAAASKLDAAGIEDYINVGFVFPKMSHETWETIKDLFNTSDIGDMGKHFYVDHKS